MVVLPMQNPTDVAFEAIDLRCNVKRALCVGISYRKSLPYRWQLPHTHDDAKLVAKVLKKFYGYREEDITLLLDDNNPETGAEPTEANIRQAMKDLVADVKYGDRLVFHYSGHGSQVVDENGDEDDGMDEVIWPADIQVDVADPLAQDSSIRNYIVDDDIKSILVDSLPYGVHLTIIFDSCHSGTAADLPHHHSDHYYDRPLPSLSNGRNHPKILNNVVPMDHISGMKEYQRDPEEDLQSPLSPPSPSETNESFGNFATVVSWSACKDPQVTFECHKGGIFVCLLAHILEKKPNTTHRQLLHDLTDGYMKVWALECQHANENSPEDGNICKPPRPQLATLGNYGAVISTPVCF